MYSKFIFQNSTKDRMTHFNIYVTVKHHRGNNFEVEDLLTDIQNCCIKAAIIVKNSKDFWNIMNLIIKFIYILFIQILYTFINLYTNGLP